MITPVGPVTLDVRDEADTPKEDSQATASGGGQDKTALGKAVKQWPGDSLRPLLKTLSWLGVIVPVECDTRRQRLLHQILSVILLIYVWFFTLKQVPSLLSGSTQFRDDVWPMAMIHFLWQMGAAILAAILVHSTWESTSSLSTFFNICRLQSQRVELDVTRPVGRWATSLTVGVLLLSTANVTFVGCVLLAGRHWVYGGAGGGAAHLTLDLVSMVDAILFLAALFHSTVTWLGTAALTMLVSTCLFRYFSSYNKNLEEMTAVSGALPFRCETFRRRHLALCRLVTAADLTLRRLTAVFFTQSIIVACVATHRLFTVHLHAIRQSVQWPPEMTVYSVWLLVTLLTTLAVTCSCSAVHTATKGAARIVFEVGISETPGEWTPGRLTPLTLFLAQVTNLKVGLTVGDVLVITAEFSAAMFAFYTFYILVYI